MNAPHRLPPLSVPKQRAITINDFDARESLPYRCRRTIRTSVVGQIDSQLAVPGKVLRLNQVQTFECLFLPVEHSHYYCYRNHTTDTS